MEVTPVLMDAMLEGMSHPDGRVRIRSVMGAATLAKTEALRSRAQEVQQRVLALAGAAGDADQRCAYVLALGDLGDRPVSFLDDPSSAVRMCAALAPGLATDPAAINVLIETLEQHVGEIDDWFKERPPQFGARPRFAIVARLTRQVKDFDRIANAAIAVARITSKYCVDYDWGLLLVAAFPDGTGEIRTSAQRCLLQALVDNKELWDPTFGNPLQWFKKAGLPYDRAARAKRVRNLLR
jgi:hypothetical protein